MNLFSCSILCRLLLLVVFFVTGPGCNLDWEDHKDLQKIFALLDEYGNATSDGSPASADEARRLHQKLEVVDLHADSLIWVSPIGNDDRKPYARVLAKNSDGHVDLPRLVAGNMALQVFAIPNKGSFDTLCRRGSPLELCPDPDRVLDAKYRKKNPQAEVGLHVRDPDGYQIAPGRNARYTYPWAGEPPLTYAQSYAPYWSRDVMTYLARARGWPCQTWWDAENGAWRDLQNESRERKQYSCGPAKQSNNAATQASPGSDVRATMDLAAASTGTASVESIEAGRYAKSAAYVDRRSMYLERISYAARLAAAISRQSVEDARPEELRIIRSRRDLETLLQERAENPNLIGTLLATEGLYIPLKYLDQQHRKFDRSRLLRDLQTLYRHGLRMMSLMHFMDNGFGGAATGLRQHSAPLLGLTAAGRLSVQWMMDSGVVIDVSHAHTRAIQDTAALALVRGVPIINSHGGARGFRNPRDSGKHRNRCNNSRNLSDDDLRRIALTGGVIGVGFWPQAVCGDSAIDTALAMRYIIEQIDRMRDPDDAVYRPEFRTFGIDHIALGSDFDGLVQAHFSVDQMSAMTHALGCSYESFSLENRQCLDRYPHARDKTKTYRPFSVDEIRKIMGGNALRVFRQVLK